MIRKSPSRYLNRIQFSALQKIGDCWAPGDAEFPPFSELGCAEHIDSLLDSMPANDRNDLKTLLALLFFMPKFFLSRVLAFLELAPSFPGTVGSTARQIRLGLKGLIMTLYYSGKKGRSFSKKGPLELLGYEVSVYLGDLKR